MPGPKPRLHLPWHDWPVTDRRLWARAFGDDDPFADDTAARLSKSSKENCYWAYRRFLGFLKKHDPEAIDLQPHQRLTPDRVKAFAQHLSESTQPASRAASIDALYRAARFMMPDQDWAWLKTIKTRLQRAVPVKSAQGPVVTSVQLLDLGERLMKEAETTLAQSFQRSAAAQYRDGLIIALAAFHPLRPKNLIDLEHVSIEGNRRIPKGGLIGEFNRH
jgi:integrase/recombinase XerD